jgi:N-acyl homoserine lactone hydrolase
VRLRVFSTGRVRGKAAERGLRRYLPGGWSSATLPVNVFLVEHADGPVLFDAGQTAEAARPGYFPRWHPFLRLSRFELGPADEAGAQLEAAGIHLDEVRSVVLSHLHTDHAGGIAAFGRARVIVTRSEWQAAGGFGGRVRGYLPQHWPRGLRPLLVDFDGPPLGPFSASHELAPGLVLVPTPGHTRGHAALLVRDGDEAWLLGGDLAHSAAELEETAPEIARFCRSEGVTFLAAHDDDAPALLQSRPRMTERQQERA